MNELISSAFPEADAGLLIAVDLFLKATIVLWLAYAVHALLGRRRALARSALWNATLVGAGLSARRRPIASARLCCSPPRPRASSERHD